MKLNILNIIVPESENPKRIAEINKTRDLFLEVWSNLISISVEYPLPEKLLALTFVCRNYTECRLIFLNWKLIECLYRQHHLMMVLQVQVVWPLFSGHKGPALDNSIELSRFIATCHSCLDSTQIKGTNHVSLMVKNW